MQVLGGMLLHEKMQGKIPTFPKNILCICSCLYFLSLHLSPSLCDTLDMKNPSPLPNHLFPRTVIYHFISPDSCANVKLC